MEALPVAGSTASAGLLVFIVWYLVGHLRSTILVSAGTVEVAGVDVVIDLHHREYQFLVVVLANQIIGTLRWFSGSPRR